jgi:glycosyltransferase involved in cell wall biosynthesis
VAPTIWIDVEDLLAYALSFTRPSGIQRLAFELYGALQREFPDRVRFVRQDRLRGGFVSIDWAELTARFAAITRLPGASAVPSPPRRHTQARLRRWLERLPPEIHAPLIAALRHQAAALAEVGAALGALRPARRARPAMAASGHGGIALNALARPGDVLGAFGASWFGPSHPALLREARSRLGLRVALLIYDIIPLRRPEWCDPAMTARFCDWYLAALPEADFLFAISRATAGDIRRHAAATGLRLRAEVQTVPIGSGFTAPPPAPPGGRLPAAGTYVLFVSTLEVRKNHVLLVRAWRRLLEAGPAERVPLLVFAGRIGAMVADLLAELVNSDYLGGKVVLLEHPDDAELAALYRGCLFTVFPSLYEGWGLPVSESLAFGKPCLASNATAVPEAGGELARYFDPESLPDAVRALRSVLDDPAALPAWEAEVRAGFRLVAWSEAARAIVTAVSRGESVA